MAHARVGLSVVRWLARLWARFVAKGMALPRVWLAMVGGLARLGRDSPAEVVALPRPGIARKGRVALRRDAIAKGMPIPARWLPVMWVPLWCHTPAEKTP